MLQNHKGKTICLSRNASALDISQELLAELSGKGISGNPSAEQVATAMWTKYPCPFSPQRPELRAAAPTDIEGTWIFPEPSQKFRFGPQISASTLGFPPIKCEAVGYFAGGELRRIQFAGQVSCPFTDASSLATARKNPLVSTWQLDESGRMTVNRTDVPNHIEEWDVYAVTQEFTMYGNTYQVGDLVQYMRKEQKNNFNAATQFQHLKPLR